MAAPYNDLLSKLESALASALSGLTLAGTRGGAAVTVPITTGLDDESATKPRVTVSAQETEDEIFQGIGTFRVPAAIHIHSHSGEETLATHRARVATVADAVMASDIAATLAAAHTDFHCYDVIFNGLSASPTDNAFHTTINITAVCCCATL